MDTHGRMFLKVLEMFWLLSRVANSRDDLKRTYNADLSTPPSRAHM